MYLPVHYIGMRRGPTLRCEARWTTSYPSRDTQVWQQQRDASELHGGKGLVTQPAWLTHVNHRSNPRKHYWAHGNLWALAKIGKADRRSLSKEATRYHYDCRGKDGT